jgi:hypothetical protein
VISFGEKITLEIHSFGIKRGDGRRVAESGQESFLSVCQKRAEQGSDLPARQTLGNGHRPEIDLSLNQILEDIFGANGRGESVFPRFNLPGSKKKLIGG